MKRATVTLEEVADYENLAAAFWRAARGKRHREDVQRFAGRLDAELNRLRTEVLAASIEVGRFDTFEIYDPKRRKIHAPCFRERVLQHALMAPIEPVIDRYLVDNTFACRKGKGHAVAVRRAQQYAGKWSWYLKMDMRSYFSSIDHGVLRQQMRRRIRGENVLQLINRIIQSFQDAPGRGLPIGALTSQHFANLYLSPLDRYLLEEIRVGGMVRYMDDVVVWDRRRSRLREILGAAQSFAGKRLHLEIKPSWQLQRTRCGLTFCGYRVYPQHLGLSKRRRQRYRLARQRWESAYLSGAIDAVGLQAGYASALAIIHGAKSLTWRLREIERRPPVEA